MKLAHFGIFAPNQSGQYETVKDLIRAERAAGHEAHFIDFDGNSRIGLKDDWLVTENMDVARSCDLLFRHSMLPKKAGQWGKPVVLALHGRPESSFLLEHRKIVPVISEALKHTGPFLTFWPELVWTWQAILGKRVVLMPAPVDKNKYKWTGIKHQFSSSGFPNIIVCDMWREDITPFNCIFAAAQFIERLKLKGKIHIYGCPENKALLNLKNRGFIGDYYTKQVRGLETVYRAADFMVTPQVIATRSVREALASGCPIVAGGGNAYTPFHHDPRDIDGYSKEIERLWMNFRMTSLFVKKNSGDIFQLTGKTIGRVLDEIGNSL